MKNTFPFSLENKMMINKNDGGNKIAVSKIEHEIKIKNDE